jgi:choloylglycine hydrolase
VQRRSRPAAPAHKLDLAGDTGLEGGLVGDVTGRFAESDTMQFLTAR